MLLFSILAEGGSLWGCIREVNKARLKRSFITWFKESRQSELLVVFGEDIAAIAGLVVALIAVILTMVTGDPIFDAIGTIVIGALLFFIAIFLGIEVKGLLIGQGVEPHIKRDMLDNLNANSEVDTIYS